MKIVLLVVLVALAVSAAMSLAKAAGTPPTSPAAAKEGAVKPDDLTNARAMATAQNAFAADLFGQLRRQEGNLFFSPYSIATAMSMTYVGARGQTADDLAKGLHLNDLQPPNADKAAPLAPLVLRDSAALQAVLNAPATDGMELHAANALWGRSSYPFSPDYVKKIKDSFGGNLEAVDFAQEEPARAKINGWVAQQTKDKIKDLIAKGVLTPDTRLVLTNAIYFKAAWADQFNKDNTAKQPFHLTASKDVQADMMKQVHRYNLAELDGFKMLSLPYRGRQASMLILLPDKVDGLADLEKNLTAGKLAEWVAALKGRQVSLSLPRFKNASGITLNKELGELGMKRAFQAGQADFSGIADVPGEPLYIGVVIHKAFVDVNEEGTEAAAATGITMIMGMARPEEPVAFTADHPFLYVIRDDRTGDMLFMGRLADPTRE